MQSLATSHTHGPGATARHLLSHGLERARPLLFRGPIVLQTIPLLRMPEGEAPHPRPGNPCGVCMEVNDEDGNPLRGHDLGCGGTEQLHWFCSPCIANLWSCPLCGRPHRLCTAPPLRETRDRDITHQTLRTLIRQNVGNNGAREDSPDVEWLDVLTDEDPATPTPRPPWRAPTWALPDPGTDPTIYVPDYEHYEDEPRGSLPPIANLPDSWGPVTPTNLNNYHTIVVTLTTRLPIAFGWLVGDAKMGDGHRPRRPWRRVGGYLPPRRGYDPGGDREADGGLPHVEGHPPSTQPPVAGTACAAAARPAAATGHVRQCGSGQDDGQRYPA